MSLEWSLQRINPQQSRESLIRASGECTVVTSFITLFCLTLIVAIFSTDKAKERKTQDKKCVSKAQSRSSDCFLVTWTVLIVMGNSRSSLLLQEENIAEISAETGCKKDVVAASGGSHFFFLF